MADSPIEIVIPFFWLTFWIMGGIWVAQWAFVLRRHEQIIVGICTGFILESLIASRLFLVLPSQPACLISAGLVFLTGLWLFLRSHHSIKEIFPLSIEWVLLPLLTVLFFNIQRGLKIDNDLYYLSVLSKDTAAATPVHNFITGLPTPVFLFTQIQQVFNIFPWNALSLGRAFLLSLGILMAGAWAGRMTRHPAAVWVGSLIAAFAGGAGWLSLLAQNPDLSSTFDIQSPFKIPPVFGDSFYLPLVANFSAVFLMCFLITGLLLLTNHRWRKVIFGSIYTILLLVFSLLCSSELLLWMVWFSLITVFVWMIKHRTFHLPSGMFKWTIITFSAFILFLFQSDQSIWSDLLFLPLHPLDLFNHLDGDTYSNLIRIFPVILLMPWLFIFIRKLAHNHYWLEGSILFAGVINLILYTFDIDLFLDNMALGFNDSLSAIPLGLILITYFSTPLVWNFITTRSQTLKVMAAAWGLAMVLAGLFIFSIQMTALVEPVFPDGLTSLDAQAYTDYWNKLDNVYDFNIERGQTVFGKPIKQIHHLDISPMPPPYFPLIGYKYVYIDQDFLVNASEKLNEAFNNPCIKTVEEYHAKHGSEYRKILDISTCY